VFRIKAQSLVPVFPGPTELEVGEVVREPRYKSGKIDFILNTKC
jgi:hypothetical protein